jgi:hypothetical protein
MTKHKKGVSEGNNSFDSFHEKRARGRPRFVQRSEVFGRAENYRQTLGYVWSALRDPLLAATNAQDVIDTFEKHATSYAREFVPRLADDILNVIREPKFPKRPDPQIKFLADSLAGRPNVEPRTSRDICEKERAKERAQSKYKILRKDFYVECSCGYKGPALNNACRKCHAQIPIFPDLLSGESFS